MVVYFVKHRLWAGFLDLKRLIKLIINRYVDINGLFERALLTVVHWNRLGPHMLLVVAWYPSRADSLAHSVDVLNRLHGLHWLLGAELHQLLLESCVVRHRSL